MTLLGRAHARRLPRLQRDVAVLQPRPRGRQRRLLPGLRARLRARAAALPRALRGALGAGRGRGARRAWRSSASRRRRAPRRRPSYLRSAQNRDGGFGARQGAGAPRRSTRRGRRWAWRRDGRRDARVARYLRRRRAARHDVGDIERTDPRARRAGRFAAPRPRHRPRRTAAARPPPRRLLGRTGQPHRLRHPRPPRRAGRATARCAPRSAGSGRSPTATAASASPRRGGAERDRRHRGRRAGARRRRPSPGPDGAPRRGLPRRAPEPRRRLPPAARRPLERAVDRLGGPGAGRRRAAIPAACAAAARGPRWRTCGR